MINCWKHAVVRKTNREMCCIMDLQEFTKQTLIQIVEGTKEANEALCDLDAYVTNQQLTNSKGPSLFHSGLNVIEVGFDVAITATESEGSNGCASLKVASLINIGGGVDNKTENQTISRIKYSLPLVLAKK